MRILDHYIRSSVIWATGLVVLVLLGIEIFIEFISELSAMGMGNYGISSVFAYVMLQLPWDIYQFFPVAGFLGGLIGLGRLATTSELIVMRAAGVSITRIVWAVVKAALLMLIVVTIVGEWAAPTWQYQAIKLKETATGKKVDPWATQDVWLHHDNTFVRIGAIISSTEIEDIARFEFDDQNHLTLAATAAHGVLEAEGVWRLSGVNATILSGDQAKAMAGGEVEVNIGTFPPDVLEKTTQANPDQQTISSLWNNIHARRQVGLLANELESAFWARVLQPFTTIVMICLGVPFIFGSLRSASMSARLLTGIIVGFVFYMLNQFIGPLALVYQWPAWLAGALPTLLFLLIYAALLLKIRRQ